VGDFLDADHAITPVIFLLAVAWPRGVSAEHGERPPGGVWLVPGEAVFGSSASLAPAPELIAAGSARYRSLRPKRHDRVRRSRCPRHAASPPWRDPSSASRCRPPRRNRGSC